MTASTPTSPVLASPYASDRSPRLPPVSLAWLIWGLIASLYFVGHFQRVAPAVMVDELMRGFSTQDLLQVALRFGRLMMLG